MANNANKNDQFSRMRELMNFGLNENKKQPYTGLEYLKEGADGKVYAIIREGNRFYIKNSSKKGDKMVAENFEYIGGFRNRKDNEYHSYAMAQKQFDLKMASLAEAYGRGKNIVIESWNPDKQEELTVEATDKMKKEIMRERQIMENASRIYSRKPQTSINLIGEAKNECCDGDPFCNKVGSEYSGIEKNNINKGKIETGDAKKVNDGHKDAKVDKKMVKEGEEVLGWNRNPDYMDKSNGTEIGEDGIFNVENGKDIDDDTVTEGAAMHNADNQNTPKPGVGEVGDEAPFDEKPVNEAIDDIEGEADLNDDSELSLDDDGEDVGLVDDAEGEDVDLGGEEPIDDGEEDDYAEDELDVEADDSEDSLEERVSSIEDLLNRIADKLGVGTFDDDENLYDDVDSDDDDTEFELDTDDDEEEDDDDTVFESASYRKLMKRINEEGEKFTDNGRVPSGNMNKLDDFGKHPAYRKKVMSLPPSDMREFPDYYDMNDDSVKGERPYGETIGDGTPFELDVDAIDNAISESINRVLKKKR